MSELDDRVREIQASPKAFADRCMYGVSFVEIVDGVPEYVPARYMIWMPNVGDWVRADKGYNEDGSDYVPKNLSVIRAWTEG